MDFEYKLLFSASAILMLVTLVFVGLTYYGPQIKNLTSPQTTTTLPQQTTTTIHQATTTIQSSTTLASTTSYPTSTTTTRQTALSKLEVVLSRDDLYNNDDVEVTVTAGSQPVSDVSVLLDSSIEGETDNTGQIIIYGLDGGDHELTAKKQGYLETKKSVYVDPLPYAYSSDVQTQKTDRGRQDIIDSGKVVVRVYDQPNCVNCLRVKKSLSPIISENRECISYELLKIIYAGPREELKELLGVSSVVTPVVVIQGENGEYIHNGLVSERTLMSRIQAVSTSRCPIK